MGHVMMYGPFQYKLPSWPETETEIATTKTTAMVISNNINKFKYYYHLIIFLLSIIITFPITNKK